jgi:hypothetical protein
MQKMIYLAGLGHSGSTLLDMLLSSHPDIYGFGEVNAVIKDPNIISNKKKDVCSCSKEFDSCSFWGQTKPILASDKSHKRKYIEITKLFYQTFGEDKIFLDSSKNITKSLYRLIIEYDCKVIFIARDFRSWIYSRYSHTKKNMLRLALRWYLENKKLLYTLKKWDIPFLTIGYEELALFPEQVLQRICDFIGIAFQKEMLNPQNHKSHIIKGNIMRLDPQKNQQIMYDARWMTSTKLNYIMPLLIPLYRFNRKYVYSNFVTGRTKAFNKRQYDFYVFGDKRKEDLLNEYERKK